MTSLGRLLRRLVLIALVVGALVAAAQLGKGPPGPLPAAPGMLTFAVLGDAPYYPWERPRYNAVLEDMNAHDLGVVVHVGDILGRPCSDERYQRTLAEFNALDHPVVYTPGDNEWTDCWHPRVGSYAPLERLSRLREVFFAQPSRSLGTPIALETQGARARDGEFVENARWTIDGVVFATAHIVGSQNGTEDFPARTEADDAAAAARTAAAAAWVRDTFAAATTAGAPAVVIAFHAEPSFEAPASSRARRAFDPFIEAIEEGAERFARPVLLAHGDDHDYLVDQPLVRRTTGRRLVNVTRLEVPGSPQVGWVHVAVTRGANATFAFTPRVMPVWRWGGTRSRIDTV
jgi:hypothetical protein